MAIKVSIMNKVQILFDELNFMQTIDAFGAIVDAVLPDGDQYVDGVWEELRRWESIKFIRLFGANVLR